MGLAGPTPTPRPTEVPLPVGTVMPVVGMPGPPLPCNIDMFDELVADGYSEAAAWAIVNTEMDGAFENSSGGIEAFQTACHELEYNEALDARPVQEIHPADEGDVWLIVGVAGIMLAGALANKARQMRGRLAI